MTTEIEKNMAEARPVSGEIRRQEKSVKIGNIDYTVYYDDGEVSAEEYVNTLSGFGNGYGTGYRIDARYSAGWGLARVYAWNSTWACRGHGMTDSWTESDGYIRRGEANDFVEEIREELFEAEDKTPDVKEIYDEIVSKVRDATDYYDGEDDY